MKRSLPPPRKPAKVIEYTPRARTPAQPVLVADGKARMVVPIPKAAICSAPYCDGKVIAKGMCNKHYLRIKSSGSLELKDRTRLAADALRDGSHQSANGCIEWVKCLRQGYGRVALNGRLFSAHVLAWEDKNGPVPVGLQVNHKCHNRACINVDHLYVGTQTENMADMKEAGRERRARGAGMPWAKLSDINVLAIRGSTKSGAALAREYQVSESLIRSIRQRKSWAWLDEAAPPAFPKADQLDDIDYRRLVASLKCICCGAVGFSQAAHPNTGKGMSMKTDDRDCFPLCTVGASDCHGGFDQRAMFSKAVRRKLEALWANQTRMKLRQMAASDADVRKVVERSIGL